MSAKYEWTGRSGYNALVGRQVQQGQPVELTEEKAKQLLAERKVQMVETNKDPARKQPKRKENDE